MTGENKVFRIFGHSKDGVRGEFRILPKKESFVGLGYSLVLLG